MLSQKIKSILRDYFTLTSRERRGALSLATINFILIGVLLWNHYIFPPEPIPDSWFTPEYYAFEYAQESVDSNETDSYSSSEHEQTFVPSGTFNPNSLSDSGWYSLGLKEKQVRIIRNYLNKGGRFNKPEDLRRIYGIDSNWFEQAKSFIVITHSDTNTTRESKITKQSKQQRTIDINLADTTQLVELPLIGAGRARLIWKYREKLGGFYNTKQLLEVFTIDSSVFEAISPYITISPKVRTFNINADTLQHPYLPRYAARAIVAYRRQHGLFKDTTAIRSAGIISDSSWFKLVPYISFE